MTGLDSPVRKDSSKEELPETIIPSVGAGGNEDMITELEVVHRHR